MKWGWKYGLKELERKPDTLSRDEAEGNRQFLEESQRGPLRTHDQEDYTPKVALEMCNPTQGN